MIHHLPRGERHLVPGHWFGPAVVLAVGCVLALIAVNLGQGALVALVVLAASALIAVWNSPLRSAGHEPLRSVQSVAGIDRAVVVLWRPGCPYSSALRRRVTREGLRVHWVNIWRDEDAYELCRSINQGSEETPTAMVLDPVRAAHVVIPASVSGIREAAATPLPRRRPRRHAG